MGAYTGVKTIAICIVLPLILANAQYGQWSTWSECLEIGTFHNNDVIMSSHRSRSCREIHQNTAVNKTGCNELHFEIRACEQCQNCNKGSTPTTNQHELSLTVNAEELEEYNKTTADEQLNITHQENHSRQSRAADLFSFLSGSPGRQGKSRSSQTAENSQDFRQLLSQAGRKKIDKTSDEHFNSLWDLVQQIPIDETKAKTQSTPGLETQSEAIPESDAFLKLLGDTIKESVDKNKQVNPKELDDIGNLINEAEETVDNTQLSQHLDDLNKLVRLGETTTVVPITEEHLTERLTTPTVSTTATVKPETMPPTTEEQTTTEVPTTVTVKLETMPPTTEEQTTTEVPTTVTVKLETMPPTTEEQTTTEVLTTVTARPETMPPTTEEQTTTEVLTTVTVRPETTLLTTEKYQEPTTTETTTSLSKFTTVAATEEVATEELETTSTPITTPRVLTLTSRVETQREGIPGPEDFLKLFGETIKESVDKHEKVNPGDLEDIGNLINEAEETIDNTQLSQHLDDLNKLVRLGETTTFLPTTEEHLTERLTTTEVQTTRTVKPERIPLTSEPMTTLMPEIQIELTSYAPMTLQQLQTTEVVIRQTTQPTNSEGPPTQAKVTHANVQEDFLKLLDETFKDADTAHHTPNPNDLQDFQDLIEVAEKTIDNKQLSESLNQLGQILNPVELSTTKMTTEVEASPTTVFGEDLLNLIDKAGMGNDSKIQEAYLNNMLDEIGNLSESKVSEKDLDLIKELLQLGGGRHTTSTPQSEASTIKPTIGGQYLLEFLNKTGVINPEDIQAEFKKEFGILDQFLVDHNVKPDEEVRDIINKIGSLLRTAPPTTTAATTTLPVPSTTREGEALLGLIKQLEETEKKHEEENNRQVQNLEELFQGVGEADRDIFSHELNHLNQLFNPTTEPMVTTVPTVTRDKVLAFVDEIAGLPEEESQKSKEDIAIINQIFEGLQESDGDVLDNEIQQLMGLLAPTEITPTSLLTTEPYKTTAKMAGEELINFIDEFDETKPKTGEKNKDQIQSFEQLFKEVKETNKDILSHEINHLNQLFNPSTMTMETSAIPTKNVLDFVDRFIKLTLNETLTSRAEVNNLDDLFQALNESDEAVLSDEINQLLGLLMPTSATTVAPPTTTLSGQYLLELFNKTELINKEKLLDEWGNDINLVDGILEKVPLHLNEDLLNNIGNLLKEKTTPFPATTEASETKEQQLLDLMETLGKMELKVSDNNLIEVQALEEIFNTSMGEDKDKLMEDLAHLQSILSPETQPLTTSGVGLLDFIDGIRETEKDKLEGEQGLQDIQDVLVEVLESNEEDMLAAEVDHLAQLFMPTVVPTTAYVSTVEPTIEGKYILDLLLGVEQINGSKLLEDLKNDESLVNQFVNTGKVKFGDDLEEAIGQIGMLLIKKTTEAPATTEANSKLILDLIDTLGKEKVQAIQGVQDIQNVLVEFHEQDGEDILEAEVDRLSQLFLPATTTPVPTTQPTVGRKYILDFLLKVGQVNASELIKDLRNDKSLVDQFVETGKRKMGDDLQEAIDQIALLLSKKTTETPVSTPTTTTEAGSQLFLDLIDTLSKQKLQELQGAQDIQNILGEVREEDAEAILEKEVEHIADLFLPTESELSSTQPPTTTPYPTVGGMYILHFLQQVEQVNWNELKDNFNDDNAVLNQFLETVRLGDDLEQAIGQIGILMRTETTSEVPETTSKQPARLSTDLLQSPRPDSELFLDLIADLGKTKAEAGNENLLVIQNLKEIFDKEKNPTGEILDVELDRLNQLWGPTETALVTTPLETTMAPTTRVSGEHILDLFDEMAEITKDQHGLDNKGLSIINSMLKGVLNETDRFNLNDEVKHMLGLLQPEEVQGSTLGPTKEVTTHLEGFEVTSVETKNDQEALFDLLSGHSMFENKLREDTDEVQNIVDFFENFKQTDKNLLANEIAKLKNSLLYSEPTTPAVPTSTEETTPTTPQLPYAVSTLPTEVSPSFTTHAGEETFLDNLRYLVGRINTDLPWDDMQRVGALSRELDKDAEQKMKEQFGFVKDIMHDVGEREKSTPKTSHVTTTSLMQKVTATAHASTTTNMMTSAINPTEAVLVKETTEGVVVKETTEGVAVKQTTEGVLVKETTEGVVVKETTEGVLVKETTEGVLVKETTEGVLVKETTEGVVVKETTEGLVATPETSSETTVRLGTTTKMSIDRWTDWSSWGDCSSTCGLGEQSRNRDCRLLIEGLAIPSTNCEGSPAETIGCDMGQCPVPSTPYSPVDRWTEWSSWGDCSNTCGMGEQSRMRDCRLFIQGLVIPSSNCEGSPAETMACELRRCPVIPNVDGRWSEWSTWTDCSSKCGPGNQTHYRGCDSPAPSGDGLSCEGAMTESQDCLGDPKLCQHTPVEEPLLIRTTPKPHIVRPSRKPVDKTVAVAVLATFISVVVVVLISCIVFKTRKSYGKREYRGDRPMFYR
ncbi:uncharacterized protein [Asterias amurensis]|uniref:uncharacterized protein isoform X2 n=1 Tax=Asterias amurensis TaxID=7602 RepID=UPI003AB7F9DD